MISQKTLIDIDKYHFDHDHLIRARWELSCQIQCGLQHQFALILGPSGVGKTSLLNYFAKKLTEYRMAPEFTERKSPPILLNAPARVRGSFQWKPFLTDLISKLGADMGAIYDLDRHVSDLTLYAAKQVRVGFKKPQVETLHDLAASLIDAQKPLAIFIDEGQHFSNSGTDDQRREDVDRLKTCVNDFNTKLVLAGTYEGMGLIDYSEQVARRNSLIEFPRYGKSDVELKAYAQWYVSVCKKVGIDVRLPPLNDPEYVQHYTLGVPGIFTSWLQDALSNSMRCEKSSVTEKALISTRPHPRKLKVAYDKISQYEQYNNISFDQLCDFDLIPSPGEASDGVSRKRSKPGRRLPTRDPIGRS
jgi:GTPase SAR1 family protein